MIPFVTCSSMPHKPNPNPPQSTEMFKVTTMRIMKLPSCRYTCT